MSVFCSKDTKNSGDINDAGVVIRTEDKSISTTLSLFSADEYTINTLNASNTRIGFLNPTILIEITVPALTPPFLKAPSISSLLLSFHAHRYWPFYTVLPPTLKLLH